MLRDCHMLQRGDRDLSCWVCLLPGSGSQESPSLSREARCDCSLVLCALRVSRVASKVCYGVSRQKAEFPCSHCLFVYLFSEIGSYLVGLGLGVQTRLTSNSESRLPLPPKCWVKGRLHYTQLLPSGFENQSRYLGSKVTLLLVSRK